MKAKKTAKITRISEDGAQWKIFGPRTPKVKETASNEFFFEPNSMGADEGFNGIRKINGKVFDHRLARIGGWNGAPKLKEGKVMFARMENVGNKGGKKGGAVVAFRPRVVQEGVRMLLGGIGFDENRVILLANLIFSLI